MMQGTEEKVELLVKYLYGLNKIYFPGEKIKFFIDGDRSMYYIHGLDKDGVVVFSIAANGSVWFMNRKTKPIQVRHIDKIDWNDYV